MATEESDERRRNRSVFISLATGICAWLTLRQIAIFIKEDNEHSSHANRNQKKTGGPNRNGSALSTQPNNPKSGRENDNKPYTRGFQSPRFWDCKFSTVSQFVFGFGLFVIGIAQWRVYDRQADIMETQANISQSQQRDSRITQRAFVNVPKVHVDRVFELIKGEKKPFWRFSPELSNDGNTSTNETTYVAGFHGFFLSPPLMLGIGTWMEFKHAVDRAPNRKFFPENPSMLYADKPPKIALFIGPHGTREQVTMVALPEIEFREAVQHGWRPYIFGEIKYKDVFDSEITHVTKYCYLLTGEDGIDGFKGRTSLCDYWNCADDECTKDESRYTKDVAADNAKHPSQQPYPTETYILQYDPQ